MTTGDLQFRQASSSDCEMVFEWISDEAVRSAAFSTEEISLETHQKWFEQKLNSKNSTYWIAEWDGKPIGQVRFERKNDEHEVSIVIAKAHRGQSLGHQALSQACDQYARENGIDEIQAFVRADNPASLKLFEKTGFQRLASKKIKGCEAVELKWKNNAGGGT